MYHRLLLLLRVNFALESLEIASSILLFVLHMLCNPLLGVNLENFLAVALNKLPQLRHALSGCCNTHSLTLTHSAVQWFHMLPLSALFLPFISPLFLRTYASMT